MEASIEYNDFLNYLRFERRYSDHTTRAYQTDLREFYFYLDSVYGLHSIQEVKALHIRSWMVQLTEAGRTATSIHRKISSLKSYCKYLLKIGALEKSPVARIVKPKQAKKLPITVDEPAIHRLFDEIVWPEGFVGQRDRLILAMLYSTGMRRAELVGLKLSDVDLGKKQLKVFGKRAKERIIPINSFLFIELNQYLSDINKQEQSDHRMLLVDDRGKPVTAGFIYRKVTHYLSQVSTAEKRSPHVLRHAFATHLLDHGAELNAVKELLGHAGLAATQIYTHNSIEKLREVFKSKHPKA